MKDNQTKKRSDEPLVARYLSSACPYLNSLEEVEAQQTWNTPQHLIHIALISQNNSQHAKTKGAHMLPSHDLKAWG